MGEGRISLGAIFGYRRDSRREGKLRMVAHPHQKQLLKLLKLRFEAVPIELKTSLNRVS